MLLKRINKSLLLLFIISAHTQAQNSDNIYAVFGFPELCGIGIDKSNFKLSVGTIPWANAVFNKNNKPCSIVFSYNKFILQKRKIGLRATVLSSYIYGLRTYQELTPGGIKYRNDAIAIGPRIGICYSFKKIYGEFGTGLNCYFENTFYSNGTSDRFELSDWGIYSFSLNLGYKY